MKDPNHGDQIIKRLIEEDRDSKQEIAEQLRDSGLFPHDGLVPPWPTSDQSEAFLSAMGLQVVWDDFYSNDGSYSLGHFEYDYDGDDNKTADWIEEAELANIPKGQRTLANNAGLAKCCKHRLAELEQVINQRKEL